MRVARGGAEAARATIWDSEGPVRDEAEGCE